MRSRALEAYKSKLKLTKNQHEVLVGLLLGDGHIEQPYLTLKARLKFEQRAAMRPYVELIYDIFQEWVRAEIKMKRAYLKTTKKWYAKYYFSTFVHEDFMVYRNLFYESGKKVVPANIGRILTPRGLATWFMDDGSIKSHQSKGRIINTHSFTQLEVERLCEVLNHKFNLDSWPRKQRDGIQIYISGKSATMLQNIIESYVIPEMTYKLPWFGH